MSYGIIASSSSGAGIGGGTSAYASAVMQDNPTLFLKFDETVGSTVATDSSGNGRNGAYVNTPYLHEFSVIPGSTGRSARFENGPGNEPSQHVTIPYGSWMDSTEVTITFACFADSGSYRLMATRYGEPGNDWSWFVYILNNRFYFHYRSDVGVNTNIDSGVSVLQGKRYFVAAYAGPSGAGIRVYDETGLLGSATGVGGTVNPSSRSITLMNAETLNYSATGYLDGLAVFDTALPTTRLDTYATYAMAPDAVTWTSRSSGTLARNGTSTQTINFTPALAGSLLVVVVASPTAHTALTAGWTKRLSPSGTSELAVFTRNANVGDASLMISMSSSNFPLLYTVYEFPAGSYWYGGAQLDSSPSIATLGGLPGSGVTVFMGGAALVQDTTPIPSNAWWYFWKTDTNIVELNDGVSDGAYLGLGYFINFPDATADITVPALQIYGSIAMIQNVMFAIATP